MAMAKRKEQKTDPETEIRNAITGFERILEAMPNDRASLEALTHAYEQVGDEGKAKEHLFRLMDVLLAEGDIESARERIERARELAGDDPKFEELTARLEEQASAGEGAATAVEVGEERRQPQTETDVGVRRTFNMVEELSFAWNLMEANELTQEEYANVVQDLTEMSAGDSTATVSIFHVLEARGAKNMERVIAFVAKECGTPFVSLSGFQFEHETVSVLPMDFMVQRGAVVFESVGPDALVVVMNPYDKHLRKDVEALCGKKCHFFVTLPSEFDQMLDRILNIEAEPTPTPEQ